MDSPWLDLRMIGWAIGRDDGFDLKRALGRQPNQKYAVGSVPGCLMQSVSLPDHDHPATGRVREEINTMNTPADDILRVFHMVQSGVEYSKED